MGPVPLTSSMGSSESEPSEPSELLWEPSELPEPLWEPLCSAAGPRARRLAGVAMARLGGRAVWPGRCEPRDVTECHRMSPNVAECHDSERQAAPGERGRAPAA